MQTDIYEILLKISSITDRPRAVLCRLLNCIYFVAFIHLFIYYAVAVAANKDVYYILSPESPS